jgi:hypothetical protein
MVTEGPHRSKRRKVRQVRAGDTPDDLVVVIPATPASRAQAADDIAEAARVSAEVYVILHENGFRELLFGVSVYARRPGVEPDVSAWRLVTAAGDLLPNPFYAGGGGESPEDR